MSNPVGFDVGTTISVASFVNDDGVPEAIHDKSGRHLISSAVHFESNVVTGSDALELGLHDPDGLANVFKRDIGKAHCKKELRSLAVPPEILTGFLIRQLARNVRSKIGDFGPAVITVPAHFDEKKRTATQQAAQLAGVEVLSIINEPTAAAIAVGHQMLRDGELGDQPRRFLVYDLGGGTFDVTLLEYRERTFRTIGTDGDIYLGGEDFDKRLVTQIAERFMQEHGVDPRINSRDLRRLWTTAREVKHELSRANETEVRYDLGRLRLRYTMMRSEFEQLIAPLVERTMTTAQELMDEAQLNWQDVDDFLLVGGSSRIPCIAKRAEECFGTVPRVLENPDELMAYGAALFAAAKSNAELFDESARFKVVNVNAHSLGIQGVDKATNEPINKILIPRNSPLPVSKSWKFVTNRNNQKNVKVQLLEGESENPRYCMSLGECYIRIDTPLPAGTGVRVTCSYSTNGTISVTAKLNATNATAYVELRRDGHSTLDSLETWERRLTLGESTEQEAESDEKPPLSIEIKWDDKQQLMQRLDSLYGYIGSLASSSTPATGTVSSHRLMTSLVQETQALKVVIQKLVEREQRTKEPQAHDLLTGQIAQAKMAFEHSKRLLDHSLVALGREVVESNAITIVANEAAGFAEEIRELHEKLEG